MSIERNANWELNTEKRISEVKELGEIVYFMDVVKMKLINLTGPGQSEEINEVNADLGANYLHIEVATRNNDLISFSRYLGDMRQVILDAIHSQEIDDTQFLSTAEDIIIDIAAIQNVLNAKI